MKILLILLSLNTFAGFTEFPPISGGVGGGGGGGDYPQEYTETEVSDGTWKNIAAFRRCFTITNETTGQDVLITTFAANLNMITGYNYFANLQLVVNYAVASGYGAVVYDPADGHVSVYTSSYKFGAGEAFCLRYTK